MMQTDIDTAAIRADFRLCGIRKGDAMTTAQSIFDRIQSGDESLRANVNRAAARAEGRTNLRIVLNGRLEGCPAGVYDSTPVPDYCGDLNASAGLIDPPMLTMRIRRPVYGADSKLQFKGDVVYSESDTPNICGKLELSTFVRFSDKKDEALARTVCWYVATGGEE